MGQGQKMFGGWSGKNDWLAKIWQGHEKEKNLLNYFWTNQGMGVG
jgi:hypothetical protein